MRKLPKIGNLSKAELRILRGQVDAALSRKRREIEATLSLLTAMIGNGQRRARKAAR